MNTGSKMGGTIVSIIINFRYLYVMSELFLLPLKGILLPGHLYLFTEQKLKLICKLFLICMVEYNR